MQVTMVNNVGAAFNGRTYGLKQGETIDLPDALAADLIKAKHARKASGKTKKSEAETESGEE